MVGHVAFEATIPPTVKDLLDYSDILQHETSLHVDIHNAYTHTHIHTHTDMNTHTQTNTHLFWQIRVRPGPSAYFLNAILVHQLERHIGFRPRICWHCFDRSNEGVLRCEFMTMQQTTTMLGCELLMMMMLMLMNDDDDGDDDDDDDDDDD
jgi:hypothetical protein